MLEVIDLDWIKAHPEAADRMIQRLVDECDEAKALAAAAAAGFRSIARPITMQDVRLAVGEGDLTATDVLAGCNAELRRRGMLAGVGDG